MPKAHREYAELAPQRLSAWAAGTGADTAAVVQEILGRRAYPEHAYRSCLGVLSLAKRFGKERLEAACARALAIRGVSYKSIKSILENNLDAKPLPRQLDLPAPAHDNLRGTGYFTR
jgi:transposase